MSIIGFWSLIQNSEISGGKKILISLYRPLIVLKYVISLEYIQLSLNKLPIILYLLTSCQPFLAFVTETRHFLVIQQQTNTYRKLKIHKALLQELVVLQ